MEYGTLFCPLGSFRETADSFRSGGGRGLNITVPFKEDAFRYADTLTERAKTAGAVNTLRFNDDGTVLGDNTDGAGFIADLKRLKWPVSGKRVLVMGAGGAARGILMPLQEERPLMLFLANRTVSRAEALAREFPKIVAGSYEDLASRGSFDLVINIPKNFTERELRNGYLIRRKAVDHNIPLITNARLASAFIHAVCKIGLSGLSIKAWQEY